MGTWVNWAKKVPKVRGGRKLQFFSIFLRVFENEGNPHILTPGQLKYTNSLIWIENGHVSELSKKTSPGLRWAKTSIFSIFLESFRKWRKSSNFHSRTTKMYKFTHLDGKWAHEWIEPKKFPKSTVGEIFNFFRFFWKVFENEESPHILTPGQLKYTISLIWVENGHMSKLSLKSSPGPRWAKTSIFSIFFKSFRKWRKSSYSHSRTTKMYQFTHLNGKWEHERIEPKKYPRSTIGENFNFFDFLKIFWKWRKYSYSHSRTTKMYQFTYLDGKWAHEWIEPKQYTRFAVGENNLFNFLKSL